MLDHTALTSLLEDARHHIFDEGCSPVWLPACDHYAGNPRFAEKALQIQQRLGPVLDITLDLEDGAQVGQEDQQAQWAANIIQSSDNHFDRIGVRIHDLDSPFWQKDLETLVLNAGERLAYIMLPKLRSIDQMNQLEQTLHALQKRIASNRRIPLHALIETHTALRDIHAIAAHPAIDCLAFGLMDFVSAHYGAIPSSAMRTPGQFEHPLVARAKLEIASACATYGKVASHNVTTEVRDPAVVLHDAQQARHRFGFTRMWSIHPMHIDPIVRVMSPSSAEQEEAELILQAAQHQRWGPIRHGDTLHDRASFRYYLHLLQAVAHDHAPQQRPH
jgi:citrate lyase subunit beta / citryl-CoA lyase